MGNNFIKCSEERKQAKKVNSPACRSTHSEWEQRNDQFVLKNEKREHSTGGDCSIAIRYTHFTLLFVKLAGDRLRVK